MLLSVYRTFGTRKIKRSLILDNEFTLIITLIFLDYFSLGLVLKSLDLNQFGKLSETQTDLTNFGKLIIIFNILQTNELHF